MDISQLSLIELIAGTVTGMLLGAFWYSPIAFGNSWMKSLGKTTETIGSQTIPMIGSVIACVLTTLGVAMLHSSLSISSLQDAACLGAVLGFLIIFPALLSDNLFCGWGTKLLWIQAGYRILSIVLISIVIFYV